MNIDVLREELIAEAMARGGSMALNLSLDAHYEFFVHMLGGEQTVKNTAPEMYEQLRWQRSYADFLSEEPDFGIEDYTAIRNYQLKPSPYTFVGEMAEPTIMWNLQSVPTASYTRPIPGLSIVASFYDEDKKQILCQDTYNPKYNQDDKTYSCVVTSSTKDDPSIRHRRIRATGIFNAVKSFSSGRMMLAPKIATTVGTIDSNSDDIKAITLHHPIITNAHLRSTHKDSVFISYNRKSEEPNPDYEIEVKDYEWWRNIPVSLPYSFTIELQNRAYFTKKKNSYFYPTYDPNISLTKINVETTQETLGGEVWLKTNWAAMSSDPDKAKIEGYVDGDQSKPNKIKFTFPIDWESNLSTEGWKDWGTSAELYSYIPLNTVNYQGEEAYDGVTPIIVKTDVASKKNEVQVAPIFYKWGCVAENVIILTDGNPTEARDIRMGDYLMSASGKKLRVRDISSGTEEKILLIVTYSDLKIRVTGDHTLCAVGDGGAPVGKAACDLREERDIFVWDAESQSARVDKIRTMELVDYGGKVYNFEMEESDFIIGNGILIGDIPMQNRFRPEILVPEYPFTTEMLTVFQQMSKLLWDKPYPEFQQSNRPESLQIHYFAVKTLANVALFNHDQAQTIAEFCQFLADNATTGGLKVPEIPTWCNEKNLYRCVEEGFEVPVIPTAMRVWYDETEMNTKKPWFNGQNEPCYDVRKEILGPVHFFLSKGDEDTPGVVFNPKNLQDSMNALAAEIAAYKNNPKDIPRELLMKAGIYLHILLDTKLHEHFCAPESWINMALRSSVDDAAGNNISADYPPYKEFEEKRYEDMEEFPSGLQRISWAVNETFAALSYEYPLYTYSLGDHSMGYLTWGHSASRNPDMYAWACAEALHFLEDCMGKTRTVDWMNSETCKSVINNFKSKQTGFNDLSAVWKKTFTTIDYAYDACDVYEKLLTGDEEKEDPNERYAEFYNYLRTLYEIIEAQRPLQNSLS